MNKTTKLWLTLTGCALIAGCSGSNSYTPAAGVPGGKIYADACANCHSAAQKFEIAADIATIEAVSNKIKQGSLGMPSFPNIQGDALKAVAEYVVKNSAKK